MGGKHAFERPADDPVTPTDWGGAQAGSSPATAPSPSWRPPDEKSSLRLELVKLVHRFDRSPSQVIERARELEAYVNTGQAGSGDTP
jgi:hypothetical protein